MKKYKNKKDLKNVKKPKLSKESVQFLNKLPTAQFEKFFNRHKERMLNIVTVLLVTCLAGGILRDVGVIEKPNLYTNNEEKIQENLKIVNERDSFYIKSILNREILVNLQKNYTVGINPSLGVEHEVALREAVNYMNYVLQGLNPEYSISIESINDPLKYNFADIVVSDTGLKYKITETVQQVLVKNPEVQTPAMTTLNSQGFINNNGIYKSNIIVNKAYFDDIKQFDHFYDYTTSAYIHELCHCIFGFKDVNTQKFTIMDYKDSTLNKCMYYTDLIYAAASICDLSNEDEKERVYNFISQELMRQVELGIGDEEYREYAQKEIARLQAEIAVMTK